MKKLLSIVLTMLMLLSVICIAPVSISAADEAQLISVYFENNWLWTNLFYHSWGSSLATNTEWGKGTVELVGKSVNGNDVYKATIGSDATGVIFAGTKNDGSGATDQTPDIKSGFYDGVCYSMTWNGSNAVVTSDIADVCPELAVEPTEAPATEAPATEAPVTETPDVTETPATEAPVTETPDVTEAPATEAPATEAPVVETMTIYFENNWAWPDAKIYFWGSTTGTNPDWPGVEMTYVDTTEAGAMRYSFEVPTDITGMLFNGTGSYGSEQCVDIKEGWYDGICYYMTYDSATNTKPAGSYEYAPIVTPDPTEAPATESPATTAAPTEAPATEVPATTAAPTDTPVTEAPATTAAPVVPEYVTIYFTNNWGWTNVSVHTFNSAFEPDTNWPGKLMDLYDTNEYGQQIYTAQIPADALEVVFTGTNTSGGTDQSSNTVVRDGYGYYMDWNETDGSHAVEYEFVPVTPEETTSSATEAPVTTETPATDAPATDAPAEFDVITVFFQNNWFWSDVKIHIWGASDSAYNTEWPGTEMSYYDNDGTYDYYSYNIPTDVEGFLITGVKNDGSGALDKTPDIKEGFYEGVCYYMTWSDGNQVGSFNIMDADFSGGVDTPSTDDEVATDDEVSTDDEVIPAPETALKGSTVTLGGKLGVNFWFEITEEILADETAKVVMNIPNTGEYTQVEIPVSEGMWVDGWYVFTAEVAAKEMTSVIEVQLVATDFETIVYSYTVQEYLGYILTDVDNYSDSDRALVKALLNYGAASQVYFNYNADDADALANSILSDEDKVVSQVDLEAYAPVIVGEGDAVKYYGASLVLKSNTTLKLYFCVDETTIPEGANPAVNINGMTAGLEQNGDLWVLEITDVSALELDTVYNIGVGNGCTITYSALSYAYVAQQSSKPALVDLANALAAYYNAAVAYNN